MRVVLGAEDEEQWMDSELPGLNGDVQWLIRPLTPRVLRVLKEKARRNPLARRHQVHDPIEDKQVKLDGNEFDALSDEIANYTLANFRGVVDKDGNDLEPDTILRDSKGNEMTAKQRLLDNLDIVAEVVAFGRKLGGVDAVAESRKN